MAQIIRQFCRSPRLERSPTHPSQSWLVRIFLLSLVFFATVAATADAQTTPVSFDGAVDYRLGPGDQIRISVYQSPDLSLETRLSDRGEISYPLLGSLRLGGRTIHEAESLIAQGLKAGELLRNPQVTLILMEVRGNMVNVLGQVTTPGRYPLLAGETRLSDVIATAGGIASPAGSDVVTVIGIRNGQPFRRRIDLPQVFSTADRAGDLILQANDVVFVDRAPLFYIYGEVQRPGQYRIDRSMTLLQGLAAGGGLTLRGSDKGIRMHRRNKDSAKTEILQPEMDEMLRDGDVIYVRESLF